MSILDSPKVWLVGVLLGITTELLWKRRLNDDDNSVMESNDDTPGGMELSDDDSVMVLNDDKTALVLNDDIVWEILVRLPTRALMRFKCVSKHWNSIIGDPLFAKAYIGSFHGFLIAEDPWRNRLHEEKGIAEWFYASCFNTNNGYNNKKKNNIQAYNTYPVAIDGKFDTNGTLYFTNIVKGLFGLYNKDGEFTLFNITTHEVLDLPITSLRETNESSDLSMRCNYYLEFEPVREVYKLLRICYTGYYDDVYLQICTLGRGGGGGGGGNLDWRSLGQVPQLDGTADSMQTTCINEILYLIGWKYMDWNRPLVVFDLSTETISKTIPLPEAVASFVKTIELVQLGGRPALISLATQLGKIWVLDNNGSWTEILCVALVGIFDLICAGNLPTGELLLAQRTKKNCPLPIYKYDHIQNKVMKCVEVDLCFSSIRPGYWYTPFWKICYYEANILPLSCFVRRQ